MASSYDAQTIRAALDHAEIPALLPALAYLTGDLRLLPDELRPDPSQFMDPNGGISGDKLETARQLAFDALQRFLASGSQKASPPDPASLQKMLEFLVGGEAMEEYLPLFMEELAVDEEDMRAPGWKIEEYPSYQNFRVGIIGAGMSGLAAAHRLDQAGIDYLIFDKNPEVGGTWLENAYPGCRVDVPNFLYSYSFAQRDDWPEFYSTQPVLLEYFQSCARALGLAGRLRLGTEVLSASYEEDSARWCLDIRSSDGAEERIYVNAIISAVGQLNRPKYPDIAGIETFAGPSFHSARWDKGVDLMGKRVGVIGTGASAIQIVSSIADHVGELAVFQRTPTWLAPTPEYHQRVPEEVRWLFRNIPTYAHWHRFWLFWKNAEALLPLVSVDPSWDGKGRSVSAMNELLRELLEAYLDMQFSSAPELFSKVVPVYPPAAKRIVRDDGSWAQALMRENVTLVTEPISEVTEKGVRMADGTERILDVLIYATGFQASEFLTPMRITGVGGVELHDKWGGDARAYLGITVPGFPNLFCIYGPNTNIVINGSIIYFSECAVGYVLGCLRMIFERKGRALDCKVEVHDQYNVLVDKANELMAWGASSVNSWYKNRKGRVSQNWPYSLLEYWKQTKAPSQHDYELL